MKAAMGFVLGLVVIVSANVQAQLPEFTKLVEDVAPAVVNISTRSNQPTQPAQKMPDMKQLPPIFREFFERGGPMPPQKREGRSLGSGFIISKDGYVLTNNHVVAGADTVIVRLNDRREFVAEIIGADPRSDVAVLKIDADNLPVVKIAKGNNVKRGQWVVAIGSPFGFDYSVTAGIVSATGRALPDESYVPFIQTDVAINPGNSGGPLFNLDGEVIGINSQIFTRSGGFMGLSFAIPTDLVMNVAEQIKEKGLVRRGWLGVLIQEVNADLALSFGLDRPMGALIAQASAAGPAGKAGVQPGDVVVLFNGKEVERSSDLPPMVGLIRPGTTVPIDLVRQGKRLTLDVTIEQLPEADQLAMQMSSKPRRLLGMSVEQIPGSLKSENNLKGGILVKEVSEEPAISAGLRTGDIITQVGGREILKLSDLDELLGSLPTDRPIPVLVVRGGNSTFLTLRLGR
jgi:serine protease Do